MFFVPLDSQGGSSAQTIIQMYEGRAPSYLELIVPERDVTTVIGSLVADFKNVTAIERAAPRRPSVLVEVDPVEDLINRLYGYLTLSEDWDGYGGVPPDPKAVLNAEAFVRQLPEEIALPRPMIAGDGEVGLYWKSTGGYAEATFLGNDEFSFFVQRGHRSLFAENLALSRAVSIDELFELAA